MTDRDALLDAILPHVPFDGWSEAALEAGARDAGVSREELRAQFPRGAVDAALAWHYRSDDRLAARMAEADLSGLRYRDKVALAVRTRLELADRELVRKGMALFALPAHAADGTAALWHTASAIWEALGDTSRDVNWYTKRMTLSAVWSATVLYWLGDESEGNEATWEFLDRRIDDVMRIEQAKAAFRKSGLGKLFRQGPGRLLDEIKAPGEPRPGYPGWSHRP